METKKNYQCIVSIGMIILLQGYTVKPLSQELEKKDTCIIHTLSYGLKRHFSIWTGLDNKGTSTYEWSQGVYNKRVCLAALSNMMNNQMNWWELLFPV